MEHKFLIKIDEDKKHLRQALLRTLFLGTLQQEEILNAWGYTMEQRAEAKEFIEKLHDGLKESMK